MKYLWLNFVLLLAIGPALAQANPEATIIAELPIRSGSGRYSAHLSPDGKLVMGIDRDTFCLYTLVGEELWCLTVTNESNLEAEIIVDGDSVVWSPDGRYIAFSLIETGLDPDVRVIDIAEQDYRNLTDDGYGGSVVWLDKIPDGVFLDLVPAWMPDGRLTFARHTPDVGIVPSLWAVDPEGGDPEKITDFEVDEAEWNVIHSMDWSIDGSQMVYVHAINHSLIGELGVYNVAEDRFRPLATTERLDFRYFIRADFSPDGEWILLLTSEREVSMEGRASRQLGSGYEVFSTDEGTVEHIVAPMGIQSAGWMPDNSLLFIYSNPDMRESGGLFAAESPDAASVKLLDHPVKEDQVISYSAPTPDEYAPLMVTAGGLLLLGNPRARSTHVVQLGVE